MRFVLWMLWKCSECCQVSAGCGGVMAQGPSCPHSGARGLVAQPQVTQSCHLSPFYASWPGTLCTSNTQREKSVEVGMGKDMAGSVLCSRISGGG